MELNEIREHWDLLAKKHGLDLKATTKTPTIKQLEIKALTRAITGFENHSQTKSVLEVGCGNGHNIFGLMRFFPQYSFLGLDYSEEMVTAAQKIREEFPKIDMRFEVGDVLHLSDSGILQNNFDIVFTDRLLINLNSWESQQQGLTQLASCTTSGGYLILIENFAQSYENQNELRELLSLPRRIPDPYNKFIEESRLEEFMLNSLKFKLTNVENFGSLHDLILYVLLPHISNGSTVYDHPLMESVTALLELLPEKHNNCFGNFGQNKLYVFKKP